MICSAILHVYMHISKLEKMEDIFAEFCTFYDQKISIVIMIVYRNCKASNEGRQLFTQFDRLKNLSNLVRHKNLTFYLQSLLPSEYFS